uniref:39S ribosomal protein L50, mitochondrial n=1 Tax=Amphimedon queenslandica TaxID=400682 RepID=A0A1X7UA67_AMPQE
MLYQHFHFSPLPIGTLTPKESKLRPLKLSRNELEVKVKEMATTILPISDNDDWTRNRIDHNLEMKSKILYECEKQFQRQVPSNALKGISTLGDIVSFFHTPPAPPPGLLFPDLRDQSKLPQNLSVELPSQAKPRERVPFQNYDNPKHSHFPNKKELQKQYQARYKGKGGKK